MPRALIVDADPDHLLELRALLEGHGWEVDDARHDADALAKAGRHRPDVVISDPGPFMTRLREASESGSTGGANHDLAERHTLLRAILDSQPECVKLVAADGALLDMNPAGLRMIEADSLAEAVGQSLFPLVVERFRNAFKELTDRVFRGGSGLLEFEIVGLKGGRRTLETHATPLRNGHGAITALLGVTRDITESRKAEAALRHTESRYLRQRDTLIALTGSKFEDGTGRGSVYESITEGAARALGVARVSIWRYAEERSMLRCVDLYEMNGDRHSSGMELARATYPAYFGAIEDVLVIAAGEAATDPRTCEFAESYLRPLDITAMLDAPVQIGGLIDGVVCHEHTGTPRQWTEDEQVFALAIANVTALTVEESVRRRAEAELREARVRLERAVTAGNVGLWDWDLATNQVFYSVEWKRQLGYQPHELSNALDEWQTRLHPDDRDRALRAVQAYMAEPGLDFEYETRLRHKDGSYRHILARASLIRDDGGAPARFLGSHVDITRYAELHTQFLQAQKMEVVGQLAGGVAHDFNNLLTVINGTVDLLLSDLRAADPMRADLIQVRDAGERATSLTSQLLAFSRKQIMKPGVVDLNVLVHDMQDMLRRLLGETIELVFTPAKTIGAVSVDPGQIEQVVMNLVVNARDAMPDGGVVTIETQNVELGGDYAGYHPSVEPGPYVMLAVSDVGIGMDEATRVRIFEPFFTTKGPAKGTGLGLSTVYGIVKQTGGNIWVYSEPGRGTTLKVYLPQVDAAVHAVRRGRTMRATRGAGTVLVVEDDGAVRNVACRILASAGYTVLVASSGADALSVLERHDGPVHLMLTDVVMPGMSGRELANHLSFIRPRMKVLYTSGYTDDTIVRRGVLDDSAQFIGKPYTVTELTQKVRELLDATDPEPTGDEKR